MCLSIERPEVQGLEVLGAIALRRVSGTYHFPLLSILQENQGEREGVWGKKGKSQK